MTEGDAAGSASKAARLGYTRTGGTFRTYAAFAGAERRTMSYPS